MSNQQKPEKHQLMSVGRVTMEHPWYDADEVDKILDEQAKTIEQLWEALQLSKKHLRYGVPARDMKIIGDALREVRDHE